jgi:EAL domain-containing protein (putative c-di-GMP-specific phosphodiesterase class I)
MKCDLGQGFYFARPMPDSELVDFLSGQGAGRAADPVG